MLHGHSFWGLMRENRGTLEKPVEDDRRQAFMFGRITHPTLRNVGRVLQVLLEVIPPQSQPFIHSFTPFLVQHRHMNSFTPVLVQHRHGSRCKAMAFCVRLRRPATSSSTSPRRTRDGPRGRTGWAERCSPRGSGEEAKVVCWRQDHVTRQ